MKIQGMRGLMLPNGTRVEATTPKLVMRGWISVADYYYGELYNRLGYCVRQANDHPGVWFDAECVRELSLLELIAEAANAPDD